MKVRRPSASMGVALLALFVALGGTSYATVTGVLPHNSVGTPQIQDDSVTRAKIAHESITSVLIRNGSLLAQDFAAGQIPAGPVGPKGDKGDTGPVGPTGATGATGSIGQITVRSHSVNLAPNAIQAVTASCNTDERASGAGTAWSNYDSRIGEVGRLLTVSLTPSTDGYGVTSYVGTGANADTETHTFTVSVLCYHR